MKLTPREQDRLTIFTMAEACAQAARAGRQAEPSRGDRLDLRRAIGGGPSGPAVRRGRRAWRAGRRASRRHGWCPRDDPVHPDRGALSGRLEAADDPPADQVGTAHPPPAPSLACGGERRSVMTDQPPQFDPGQVIVGTEPIRANVGRRTAVVPGDEHVGLAGPHRLALPLLRGESSLALRSGGCLRDAPGIWPARPSAGSRARRARSGWSTPGGARSTA